MIAKPELRTYEERLGWARAQLAHRRATSQAQTLATSKNDDMVIGELCAKEDTSTEPALARLSALEQLFAKGKGKGGR